MENLRAIALMIASMALFAVSDAFIKAVGGSLPTAQLIIVMGLGTAFGFALICRAQGIAVFSRVFFHPAVLARNLSEMLGAIGFITALVTIPLSVASSILQAAPLVITMGAALLLGEAVGWRRWSAIAIGFVGVLIIVRPGAEAFDPNMLWALLGVFGLAGRDLASRAVPNAIPNVQLATYGSSMLIPAGILVMPISDPMLWPDVATWVLVALIVAFGATGYLAITAASRLGDVGAVTPFRYTRLIFALAIGIFFFGERPDLATYLGAALIVGSGLFTIWRERQRLRGDAAPLPR